MVELPGLCRTWTEATEDRSDLDGSHRRQVGPGPKLPKTGRTWTEATEDRSDLDRSYRRQVGPGPKLPKTGRTWTEATEDMAGPGRKPPKTGRTWAEATEDGFPRDEAHFRFNLICCYHVRKVILSLHSVHLVTYSNNKAKMTNSKNTKRLTTEIVPHCTPCIG